jgi:hypothetical protein
LPSALEEVERKLGPNQYFSQQCGHSCPGRRPRA